MVRRVVTTGLVAVVMLAGLLAWQVAEGPDNPSTIRPLPLPAQQVGT